jgi:drug/metabolite transporter (DMT)-like permease
MVISAGVRFMILAGILFSSMNVLVKLLPNIPAVELVFFRSLISFVVSFSILRIKRINPWGTHKGLLLSRGLVGAVALITYFYLLQEIPLATATTLQFITPIFTAALGIIFIKEKVKPLQWLFFGVSFLGVLVTNGFDTRISWVHIGMGLLAAAFAGGAYTIIRKLNTREHPLVIVLYFPLITLPLTGVISWFYWVMPQGIEWLILLGIGLLTQFAQLFMTKAYQSDELSKIANLKYLSLLYALVYGYFIFGETYAFTSYLGMLLVVVGVSANVWIKSKKKQAKVAG